jgi:hypothetical protein
MRRNATNQSYYDVIGGNSNQQPVPISRRVAAILQPPEENLEKKQHFWEMTHLWDELQVWFPWFDASQECMVDSWIIFQTFCNYSYWIRIRCNELDRRFGKRRDGSTRWSHAIETLYILLQDFWYITLRDIFVSIGHDVLEDFVIRPWQSSELEKDYRILLVHELTWIFQPLWSFFAVLILQDIQVLTKWEYNSSIPDHKEYIEKQYLWSLTSMTHDQFIVKCADRYHSLTHFSSNPLTKVQWKIQETEEYFLPELRSRIIQVKNDCNILLEEIFWKILRLFLIQIILCRSTLLYSQSRRAGLYSKEHEDIMHQSNDVYVRYFQEYWHVPLLDLFES